LPFLTIVYPVLLTEKKRKAYGKNVGPGNPTGVWNWALTERCMSFYCHVPYEFKVWHLSGGTTLPSSSFTNYVWTNFC
jgi:hypothetical protein